jgi:hypothetical protein
MRWITQSGLVLGGSDRSPDRDGEVRCWLTRGSDRTGRVSQQLFEALICGCPWQPVDSYRAAARPNQRISGDPPAFAIDGNLGTWMWSTESGTTTHPAHLGIDFGALTQVDRIRLYKTPELGTGASVPKDLLTQYTTDSGPLSARTWINVAGLPSGYLGTELWDATSVNANGAVTGDIHNSLVNGFASLSLFTRYSPLAFPRLLATPAIPVITTNGSPSLKPTWTRSRRRRLNRPPGVPSR